MKFNDFSTRAAPKKFFAVGGKTAVGIKYVAASGPPREMSVEDFFVATCEGIEKSSTIEARRLLKYRDVPRCK